MPQSSFSRLILFLATALLAGTWASSETLYFTVPEKDAGAIQSSDLTLKLDKKPVAITDFLSVDVSARTPEILAHPGARRNYILVFDLIFSKPEEIVKARRAASALLDRIGKDDLATVVVLSRTTGLRFWSGLTADRGKLNSALNAIGLDKVPGTILGPDGNLYSDTFAPAANTVELISDDLFLKNVTAAQAPPDEKEKKKLQDPATMFILEFSDLAYTLTGIAGRKNVILFSPGFDTKGAKIKVEDTSFADSYVNSAISEPEYLGTVEEQRAQEESDRRSEQERSRNANPVVQVDGIPEFVVGTNTSVVSVSPGAQAYDFFKDLTTKTGGLYLRDEAEVAAAADKILGLDSKFYVIGFEGRREKQFRDLHSLKIESGQKVLNPSGSYVPPRSFDQYTPLEKRLHVSQAQYENFGAVVAGQKFWADFSFQQGPRITTFSQLPGQAILKQDVDQFAMEAYGFFLDKAGNVIDFSAVPVRFDLKNKQLRERLNKAGLRVWSIVMGQKGPGTIRWVLVDSQFGDTTTWSLPVDFQDSQLTTTFPFIPSTNFDWVVWPKPQDSQTRRGVQLQYPYALGQDLFFPELNPDIRKDDKDKVIYFKIYNRLPESKNPPIHMFLVDSSGKQTEIQQFALMQKPKELEQGGMELFWKLVAMPDVPPGSYLLQVNIRDAINKKDVIREMPLEIK